MDAKINPSQKALDLFTEMIIGRMEKMKNEDWKKSWLSPSMSLPENISGRNYTASNSFLLHLLQDMQGYQLPVYMTLKQANDFGARVNKGERAFPVIYWDMKVKDKDGKPMSLDEFKNLSVEDKASCEVRPFMKCYYVFNVGQTNLSEVQPEKYQNLLDKFKTREIDLKDKEGMYENKALDRMVDRQEWVCPINTDKIEKGAYYSPSRDVVVVPAKAQFKTGKAPEDFYVSGMEYYSTMLHEMTHSTLTPERLNREGGKKFGDAKYAKEELVAELSSALVGSTMGFDSKVLDNNARYLDNWISVLREEPKFIVSVLAEVNKASDMIFGKVDEQRVALGEKPYLVRNTPGVSEQVKTGVSVKQESDKEGKQVGQNKTEDDGVEANIRKDRQNNRWYIQASFNGERTSRKNLSREDLNAFFGEKSVSSRQLADKYLKDEISSLKSVNHERKAALKV